MKRKRIIVVGSSFAGFTAAVDLQERLGGEHDVVVLSKSDQFLFSPSLIWVAFGLRSRDDVTFPIGPALDEHGVRFQHGEVTRLDLERRVVSTRAGHERYDHLVIATGSNPNFAAIPAWDRRATRSPSCRSPARRGRGRSSRGSATGPGPVVIGSAQGASCHVAAQEFLFAMTCQLRSRGLESRAPVTYVTAEPSIVDRKPSPGLASAEIIGRFTDKLGIRVITSAAIQQVAPAEVVLADGGRLPFAYAMLVPPTLGVPAVRACDRITNALGFVRVSSFGHTDAYPEVFAAGDATATDCQLSPDEMARIIAGNIEAQIRGGAMSRLPERKREANAGPVPGDAIH